MCTDRLECPCGVVPRADLRSGAKLHDKDKRGRRAGKSIGVTTGSKIHSSVTIALGAKVLNEEKKVEIDDMEYTEKVLEGGDKRPNKFTQTYSKALKGREGAWRSNPTRARRLCTSSRKALTR